MYSVNSKCRKIEGKKIGNLISQGYYYQHFDT